MPTRVRLNVSGQTFGAKAGRLVAMKYGFQSVTPRNLNQSLTLIQSEYLDSPGQLSGRRQHKPITITKEVDSASPLLLSKLCTGEHFDTIGLIFTQSDPHGGESVHSTITLTNATISSYKIYRGFIPSPKSNPKHGGSSVHSNELEEFQLVFQKIAFTNTKGSKSTSDDWTA